MFKRPWDYCLSALLGIALILGTLWGLATYARSLHRPFQNWFPQGSFRGNATKQPDGWEVGPSGPFVRIERSQGHVPLNYLHLDRPEASAVSQLELANGWRSIHVSGWFRGTEPTTRGVIRGTFLGEQGELSREELVGGKGDDWGLAEAIWLRPEGSRRLRIETALLGPGELDLTEILIVPGFLAEGRKMPIH